MWQPLYAVYFRVLRLVNTGALGPRLTPCCRFGPLHGWLLRYICHTTRRFSLRIRLSPIEIETCRVLGSLSKRIASRSRSGRSSSRPGLSIVLPAIPLRPSSRNGPSWISSSRSEHGCGNPGRSRFGEHRRLRGESSSAAGHLRQLGVPGCSSASMMM